jgi:hypothetical protein
MSKIAGYRVTWRGGSESFLVGGGGYVLLSDAHERAKEYAGKMRGRGVVACVEPIPAAKRSRCPNPRDCGDPTCKGDCGY